MEPSNKETNAQTAALREIIQTSSHAFDVLYEKPRLAVLRGQISVHPKYIPSEGRVFTVMFLRKELSEPLIRAITGNNDINLTDPLAEHMNDIIKAAEQSIRVDIFQRDVTSGAVYTLDMQRVYFKKRIRNRNIYYASKELSDQEVKGFKYENLKQVSITFIIEENTTPTAPAFSKIQFTDVITHELYSDLLTIYEINLNKIKRTTGAHKLLQTLAEFLTIKTHDDLRNFINKYNDDYSKRLVTEYMNAILDEKILEKLGVERFTSKEYQDYLLTEREEGREEGKSDILASQLSEKFSIAPSDCGKAISKFTSAQLDALGRNIFKLNSIDDIDKFAGSASK